MTNRLEVLVRDKFVIVAGSTLEGEEELLLRSWCDILDCEADCVLIIAPRHPQRFEEVATLLRASRYQTFRASDPGPDEGLPSGSIFLLNTLGDLSSVYQLASIAFIGGSLVSKGGHNPLEATRFGVPVVMGPYYENFREIVEGLREAGGLAITESHDVAYSISYLIGSMLPRRLEIGARAKTFSESKTGATVRTVKELIQLIGDRE